VLRVLARVLAAVLVIAGISWGANTIVISTDTCDQQGVTDVIHVGPTGECAGITDGLFKFDPQDPELVAVENAIRQEDQHVASLGTSYVSVAYLMPISATGGVQAIQTVTEQLEGAYAAQYYANRHDVGGTGTAPLIRLLIASDGNQSAQWRTAVDDIEHDVARQHLVAVAGLGVSLDSTMSAVLALTGAGIPVVGSSITADNFDNVSDLVRIAPSNRDEVSAALSFIKPKARTALLIEDTNPDDSYDATLVREFATGFPDARHSIAGPENYNTSSGDGTAIATRIGQMTTDICYFGVGVVLFAGRGRDLASLLTALADRDCRNRNVTIVTGDDVTNMPISPAVRQGLASGVTLEFAGNANPGEWSAGSGAAMASGREGFARFDGNFTRLFPRISFDDGNAMMGYDAMLTTISAIRLTTAAAPAPVNVVQELGALQGTRTVLGASGPIVLNANYLSGFGSNPIGKAVPILRLNSDGTTSFVQLDWPDGQPPAR
jgi:ABC-type branched-subunit amino acid transport system substrate-binding protein